MFSLVWRVFCNIDNEKISVPYVLKGTTVGKLNTCDYQLALFLLFSTALVKCKLNLRCKKGEGISNIYLKLFLFFFCMLQLQYCSSNMVYSYIGA